MDLSTLYDHEQTFRLEVKHPQTSKPTGLVIHLRSDKSRAYKAVELAQAEERMNEQRTRAPASAEKEVGRALDLAAAVVARWEWSGDANYHGEKPECTPENVRNVLESLDWVFEQVWREKANIANFTTRSATISPKLSAIASATG